ALMAGALLPAVVNGPGCAGKVIEIDAITVSVSVVKHFGLAPRALRRECTTHESSCELRTGGALFRSLSLGPAPATMADLRRGIHGRTAAEAATQTSTFR